MDFGEAGRLFGANLGGVVNSMLSSDEDKYSPENYGDIGVMDYDIALREARKILGPQFQRAKENTLGQLANDQISRGFYGQAPGDAITQQAIADLTGQYMGQVTNQAQNIRQQDFARNLQRAQYELGQRQFDWQRDYQQQQLDLQEEQYQQQQEQAQKNRRQQSQSDFWNTLGTIASIFPFL